MADATCAGCGCACDDIERRPVVEDGELRESGHGRLLRVAADYDPSIEPALEKLFADHDSVQFASYPVREPWLLEPARSVAAPPDDRRPR